MTGLSLEIVEKLARERREREARERQWQIVSSVLRYIPLEQIEYRSNPLWVGDHINDGYSYLEQGEILLPEVGPGEGAIYRDALRMLITLLNHRERDMLTDDERIQIGWRDVEKIDEPS